MVLNKADLLSADELARVKQMIDETLPRAVKQVAATNGKLSLGVLLGLEAAAEDDLAARPSHHDAEDGEHEHDDFDSFVVPVAEILDPAAFQARLEAAAAVHDVLRIKGFLAVEGKPLRLEIQGVGARFRQNFNPPLGGGRGADGAPRGDRPHRHGSRRH